MGTKKKNTMRVVLVDGRNDVERLDTVTGISKMAPQSPVYVQNPQIHAAVDGVLQLGGLLKTQTDQGHGVAKQLDEIKLLTEGTRVKYGRAIGLLRTTLESADLTVEELASLGLTGRIGRASPPPLVAPTGVKVTLGKKRGEFRATAESATGGKFGAQVSIDPIGPASWVDLPGTGKRRLITGHPSGSLVWVRFRVVRKDTASDWCAPVPVTVP